MKQILLLISIVSIVFMVRCGLFKDENKGNLSVKLQARLPKDVSDAFIKNPTTGYGMPKRWSGPNTDGYSTLEFTLKSELKTSPQSLTVPQPNLIKLDSPDIAGSGVSPLEFDLKYMAVVYYIATDGHTSNRIELVKIDTNFLQNPSGIPDTLDLGKIN